MTTSTTPIESRRASRGVTLVECLAVLAIASVLMGAGAPWMTDTMRSVRLSAASNDLLGSLLVARSEAVKRGSRVVVCKSPDGASCAATGGWEQGWLVFHDANNNGTHEAGEAVIQHYQSLAGKIKATGNLNVARYVSYAPGGVTKLASGAFQAGTITLCRQSAGPSEARQVILNSTGRPRVQKVLLPDCV